MPQQHAQVSLLATDTTGWETHSTTSCPRLPRIRACRENQKLSMCLGSI